MKFSLDPYNVWLGVGLILVFVALVLFIGEKSRRDL